jgi:hypothetical protein
MKRPLRLAIYAYLLRETEVDVRHYRRAVAHFTAELARAEARAERLKRRINDYKYPLRLPSRVNWMFWTGRKPQ